MKKILFISMLLSFSIISACSDKEEKPNVPNKPQEEQESNVPSKPQEEQKSNESNKSQEEHQSNENQEPSKTNKGNTEASLSHTQASVLKNIKNQLKTNLSITLPKGLPITEGTFLTATTKAEANQVEILFFESKKHLPINDPKLKNSQSATAIARLVVKQYQNAKEANEQIAFVNFSQNGGQEVDLGYNIKGYQDAGAGSLWTGWNEGRWAITARTRTDNPEAGMKLAKQAVQFLETHMLPIPKQNGFARLDVYESGNSIVWQDEKLVYTLDSIKEPLKALEIATAFYH
ncbi:hypothetical protein ABE61_02035 [Lysinibacillus sphaericus]|uniref:hypothetical protein n=1 Tax=Lysinibacillus sphaericus TaxID=1421 RepID=UPI001D1B8436|nr:hypothetical protein [Lysinibacillus sphaericus]MBG9452896.1 hypothetical protein [Lysinibacillus sphaericus]MBG9480103.1 hypothetical protein [Lysinibacillus sphaericus]MBG9593705.1 hypothetical protein [Lysinibacillus sphaericus]